MVYVGNNYTSADTANIAIDLVGTIFGALVAFGALIALVFLFKWVKAKIKR